jgi:methionine salvage enolase-phosphatase E1
MNKYPLIRKIYLYLFSLIGLVLVVVGSVQLVNLALRIFIFTSADKYYEYPMARPVMPEASGTKTVILQPNQAEVEAYQKNQLTSQRQRDATNALAMIIVGLPLYIYHWGVIKKDKEDA